jgi:cytochrome P450
MGLWRDPIRLFARLRSRYGDVFTVRFPSFPRLVYVADAELVKRVFTGDPRVFHAGEANATVLEPALGPYSVLTLDEDEHMRQRKLLLPPFHGKSIRRYGEVIRRIAEREVGRWPVGAAFALRPHTQRITLEVILRAVFGVRGEDRLARARRLVDEFARRSHAVLLFPVLADASGGSARSPASSEHATSSMRSSTRRSPHGGRTAPSARTCSRCSSASPTRTGPR